MLAMLAGVPGKLKSLINQVDPITLPPIAGGINFDAVSVSDSVYNAVTSSPGHLSFVGTSKSTVGTITVVDITGKGVLNYFAFGAYLNGGGNTTSMSGSVSLIIDGVTFSDAISMTTTTYAYTAGVIVGGEVFQLDQIPFNQSLKITITKGTNGTIKTVHKYRQVA